MFVRSVFANYYRLLTGAMLALAVVALTGCNEKAAEVAAPGRPVLVATVHYEAETPERSFVGMDHWPLVVGRAHLPGGR